MHVGSLRVAPYILSSAVTPDRSPRRCLRYAAVEPAAEGRIRNWQGYSSLCAATVNRLKSRLRVGKIVPRGKGTAVVLEVGRCSWVRVRKYHRIPPRQTPQSLPCADTPCAFRTALAPAGTAA